MTHKAWLTCIHFPPDEWHSTATAQMYQCFMSSNKPFFSFLVAFPASPSAKIRRTFPVTRYWHAPWTEPSTTGPCLACQPALSRLPALHWITQHHTWYKADLVCNGVDKHMKRFGLFQVDVYCTVLITMTHDIWSLITDNADWNLLISVFTFLFNQHCFWSNSELGTTQKI